MSTVAYFRKLFSSQAATSLGAFGGSWQVQSRADISTGTQVHHELNLSSGIVSIQPESDVYVMFSAGATDANSVNNDFHYAGDGLRKHPLSIPKGLQLGDKTTPIYLHIKQITSVATKYCRIVEH